MVDGSFFVPLSPPSSPRMSAFGANPVESEWQAQRTKPGEGLCSSSDSNNTNMGLLHAEISSLPLDAQRRPPLRTHKSFPYPLRPPPMHPMNPPIHSTHPTIASPMPQRERISISSIDAGPLEPPNVSYGGSAPASPVSRLSPYSPLRDRIEEGEEQQEDHEMDLAGSQGEEDEGEQKPMTAAELRAQKRKMKRFRLTHQQTRFLMSEFARQAHPDAAHRERLAREIPGLTPRQVQVWFQNRRAKLKRLTSDDRERMMRSRALPDDFDMTQALHSPFGAGHAIGTPLTSPGTFAPAYPEGSMVRPGPLSLDTFRRQSEGMHLPPSGVSPAFGNFGFTPPQSTTDSMSPADTTSFSYPPSAMDASPRRPNPFAAAGSSPTGFTSHASIPRLQLHDRISRTRADSIQSPLRTSISYSSDANFHQPSVLSAQQPTDSPSLNDHPMGRTSIPNTNLSYGLGYTYSQIPGFQSASSSRMRSLSSSIPRRIELSS
ncbi:homeobox-domain-containing protein, partial [Saccharata proteae CBS 121410]